MMRRHGPATWSRTTTTASTRTTRLISTAGTSSNPARILDAVRRRPRKKQRWRAAAREKSTMIKEQSARRTVRRALLGTLAALGLMVALVTPAAAGAKIGGGSDAASHRSGEEIPTLH